MFTWDQHGGSLPIGHAASGIEAAPSWFGLLRGTAGTFDRDAKGKAQAQNARPTVPMRGQGAERLVVAMKSSQWRRSEEVASSSQAATPTAQAGGAWANDKAV
jgi:hypothetical protein